MKAWGIVVLASIVGCCGCTARSKAKPPRNDTGVVKVERRPKASDDSVWKPLVPLSEFEREQQVYREYQRGLGGVRTARNH